MNRMSRMLSKIDNLPGFLQTPARTFIIGRVIPFAGTAGCKIEELNHRRCVVKIKNRKKVQNHIQGVHAAAMALLAESATGLLTGMTVPDDRLIVIRSMELTYLKRASGDMQAVAEFTDEHIEQILNSEKGDIHVPVTITDSESRETVTSTMIWAWVPKRRS